MNAYLNALSYVPQIFSSNKISNQKNKTIKQLNGGFVKDAIQTNDAFVKTSSLICYAVYLLLSFVSASGICLQREKK